MNFSEERKQELRRLSRPVLSDEEMWKLEVYFLGVRNPKRSMSMAAHMGLMHLLEKVQRYYEKQVEAEREATPSGQKPNLILQNPLENFLQ
ncbi:hypothetical protein JI721_15130 [Alicyclobacillus cycloheptanicus]|uniref:Transposase n=1 Tax=Alicyclobacillus cycloheptanicus TaxID=1457 RepID=A0ABT9XDA6_9BACL|nr:hypothetical protein [Alicyclobacillus cycloheptanicus]MDQ0188272.1 hypothetical protein [Alicyclobacillus cycloheptanicus]WDM00991.1 hypothetical protein JI721_15130 [Alicyclobacillus cycloheptanicus]